MNTIATMLSVGLVHYLVLAAFIFSCGVLVIVLKRNAIVVLIGIELVLNAGNLNLVAFSRYTAPNLDGQIAALFAIVLAAAEAAIAIAIFVNFYNNFASVDVDRAEQMKG